MAPAFSQTFSGGFFRLNFGGVSVNLNKKHLAYLWAFTEAYLGGDSFNGSLDYIQVLPDGNLLSFDGYFAVVLKVQSGMANKLYFPKKKTLPGKIPHFSEPLPLKTSGATVCKWEAPYLHTNAQNLKQVFTIDLNSIVYRTDTTIVLDFKNNSWYQGKTNICSSAKGNPGITKLYLPTTNMLSLLELCTQLPSSTVFKGFLFSYTLADKQVCVVKLSNSEINVFVLVKFV